MKPTLVILAAGMGSRYGGLKQLEPVGPGGATIMDYSVFDALRAGFDRVVFVIRRDFADDFRARIGTRYAGRVAVDYAFQQMDDLPAGLRPPAQRTKPWGTGHALLAARRAVTAPFAAINADDFYGAQAFELQRRFFDDEQGEVGVPARPTGLGTTGAGEPATYAMVGYPLRDTLSEHGAVSRGVCRCDANGWLQTIVETAGIERDGAGVRVRAEAASPADAHSRLLTGAEPVSMNMWGFTPTVFGHLERLFAAFLRGAEQMDNAEFYIPFAVNELIRGGVARVRLLPTREHWFGVTYREDRPSVDAAIAQLHAAGAYPATVVG